jgi:N-acetylglucosaminyl-diphospho-decaprenol L-rhamnosyltransferase
MLVSSDPVTEPTITLSVVSHGQGALLEQLLGDLRALAIQRSEIVVTLNIPEREDFLAQFADLPLRILRNPAPLGFGANHNQAFRTSRADVFVIVNPDIRLPASGFESLIGNLGEMVGACAPLVVDSAGREQDSARKIPTLGRLLRRRILRDRAADYPLRLGKTPVDWVAGMFVVFAREAFADVGGFDERYFMYMEDADICRRMRARGWEIIVDPAVRVVHDARRASLRNPRHLLWHLASTRRFLTTAPGDRSSRPVRSGAKLAVEP